MLALSGSYLFMRYPPTVNAISEMSRGFLLNALLLLLLVNVAVLTDRPSDWRSYLGLETLDWRGILFGFALLAAFTAVTKAILEPLILTMTSRILVGLGFSQSASFFETSWLPLLVVLLPVTEEIYFRGYLQNRLQDLIGPNKALLVATVTWALWHVWAPQEFLRRLLTGLCVEGVLFRWRQNTWPSLIVHTSRVAARAMLG